MLEKLSLPKTFEALSTTIDKSIPLTAWSGAVNMLIVEDYMVFIKRSDSMPSHKGQMGFMGGHKHAGEVEPITTALRELAEETGFLADLVEPIGLIEPVYTANGKLIIPVLSQFRLSVDYFLENVRANDEWDELILCPLSYLMNADNWQIAKVHSMEHRIVGFCPLRTTQSIVYPQGTAAEFLLWGASAKMLWNFFKCYE